jgi:hypothetical protein
MHENTKYWAAVIVAIGVLVGVFTIGVAMADDAGAAGGRRPRPTVPVRNGTVAVTITGGHETAPEDHGRPVVLIAAALGVPTEVFRDAFSGVTPAGSGGPTEAEAQANQQALLAVLAPYGVTNERLDEVSDFYRYRPGGGRLWTHTDATATATVVDGVITAVTITNPGAGYSSTPTVQANGVTLTATVAFGTDLATNGRLSAIAL